MPDSDRRSRVRLDARATTILIFTALIAAVQIPLVKSAGASGMAYAAPSFILFYLGFVVFLVQPENILKTMTQGRIRRGFISDSLRLMRYALLVLIPVSLIIAGLIFLLRRQLGSIFCGEKNTWMIFCAVAPCFLFFAIYGVIRAYFTAVQMENFNLGFLVFFGILSFTLVLAGAARLKKQGVKVAAILQDENYVQIYTALGAVAGLILALIIVTFLQGIVFLVLHGRLTESLLTKSAPGMGRKETMQSLMKQLVLNMLPAYLTSLVPCAALQFCIALYVVRSGEAISYPGLGALYGASGSIITVLTCLLLLPLIATAMLCGRDLIRGSLENYQAKYVILTRLLTYSLLPWAALLIATADVTVPMITGGNSPTVIGTMRFGGALVFLAGCGILLAENFRTAQHSRFLAVAFVPAFLLQLPILLTVTPESAEPSRIFLAYSIFWLTADAVMIVRDIRLFCGKRGGLIRFLMTLGCAVVSAVPAFLICHFAGESLGSAGALILSLVSYLILYLVTTLFTGAVDLSQIDRLPGGFLVTAAADAIFRG